MPSARLQFDFNASVVSLSQGVHRSTKNHFAYLVTEHNDEETERIHDKTSQSQRC
jgi:hypothetical protein